VSNVGIAPDAAKTDTGPLFPVVSGICFAALFTIGVYAALWGPALPHLARQGGVSLGDAGALFTVVFGAAIVSTALAGHTLDRYGRRWPLAIGLALNGAALIAFPFVESWPGLLALAALLGLGDGAVVVGAHVLVADLNADDEAAALNRLNVLFGLGAIAGPALGGLVEAAGGRSVVVFAGAGAVQLGYGVMSAFAPIPRRVAHATEATDGAERASLLRSRLLWLLATLLLVYVGVEIGLGGWAFTYAREAAGLGGTAAALLSSGYWGALTVGRLLSPLVLRRCTPVALLIAAPALAVVGTLALTLGGSQPAVLVVGLLVTGLGFGPVWPVTFALATRAFPRQSGGVSGLLAMVSAAGGVVIPWLQGRILDDAGPTAGISVTMIGCAMVAALAVAVRQERSAL
jgi:fucose permease